MIRQAATLNQRLRLEAGVGHLKTEDNGHRDASQVLKTVQPLSNEDGE